jgi:hypothetical protein
MRVTIARLSMVGVLCCLEVATVAGLTGCQTKTADKPLPGTMDCVDDVQYFPAGPEFKLSPEAAQMRLQAESAARNQDSQQSKIESANAASSDGVNPSPVTKN